jgi:sporulation protein YlmC with PRC-barrel domain
MGYAPGPLWVISGHCPASASCPLYKPESEMAPSGAAKPEATPPLATKTEPSAKVAEKMAAVPSDAVSVNDYYKQNVYDSSDHTIGEVSDVLLDKNGQVKAVILSVGGFLGLGGKYVSVPFNALQVSEKNGKRYLVMHTTKEALTSAPGYRCARKSINEADKARSEDGR